PLRCSNMSARGHRFSLLPAWLASAYCWHEGLEAWSRYTRTAETRAQPVVPGPCVKLAERGVGRVTELRILQRQSHPLQRGECWRPHPCTELRVCCFWRTSRLLERSG